MNTLDKRFILVVFALLVLPAVTAFQVSPAGKALTHQPGSEVDYQLRVINDQGVPLRVSFVIDGDLAEQVTLTPSTVTLSPEERERRVTLTFRHPAALTPGEHRAKIRVSAKPDGESQFVGAVTLIHNLVVHALYDGAFLEGNLVVEDGSVGQPLHVLLRLANRGKLATEATGAMTVMTTADNLSLPLGTTLLAGGEEGKLEEIGMLVTAPGQYTAQARLSYDDQGSPRTEIFTTSLRYGQPSVLFGDVEASLQAGEISEVQVPIRLQWNEPLTVIPFFQLENDEGVVTETRGATLQLGSEETAIRAFLEVPNRSGDYTVVLRLLDEQEREFAQANWTVQTGAPPPAQVSDRVITPVVFLILIGVFLVVIIIIKRQKHS